MCGIAGIVWDQARPRDVTRAVVGRMNLALSHRGPDGEGIVVGDDRELWVERSSDGHAASASTRPRGATTAFGLGHRRLAIVDLDGGAQPMSDDSARVWVTFNGEIYNQLELRAQLASTGVRFRTRSDTEVLLHAFLQWGEQCVERLEGMFAFGIWDERAEVLLLARDRLGIKPLVWGRAPDAVLFASEVKGLLASGLIPRQPRPSAIKRFLHNSYVPAPESAFAGVETLEPGRTLLLRRGQPAIRRYWHLTFEPGEGKSSRAWVDEFHARLETAVRSHLMADVPVGAFLSGGLDSSAVVALMTGSGRAGRIFTNTVGFDVPEYDERGEGRAVAEHLGADHDEVILRQADTQALVHDVFRSCDQPYADPSAVPTFALCRAARRRVKVALAGDGADELLAGYPRHRQYAALRRLGGLPRPARVAVASAARLGSGRGPQLARYLDRLDPSSQDIGAYAYLRNSFRDGWYERVITPAFRATVDDVDPAAHIRQAAAESGAVDPLQALLHVELMTYLPNDILHKVDMAGMACGLEVRVPFLDHRFVEFVAGMPAGLKAGVGSTKIVLRRAMRHRLPRRTLTRKKQGFHLPVAQWFCKSGRAILEDVLFSKRSLSRGHLDAAGARALVDEHFAGTCDHASRLWALLQLEVWHRTWVDQ